MFVARMNFFSIGWEIVTSIEDKVFLLGAHYSICLPSATKMGMVYFTTEGCIAEASTASIVKIRLTMPTLLGFSFPYKMFSIAS